MPTTSKIVQTRIKEREREGYTVNEHGDVTGFHVVCSVGTISFTGEGLHPAVAAMQLIVDSGGSGVYRFPHENGGTIEVTIPGIEPEPEPN